MTGTLHDLQGMLWPEARLCPDQGFYVRGGAISERTLRLAPGGTASFDTYANVFNAGKWRKHCGLERLWLRVRGQGRARLTVHLSRPNPIWPRKLAADRRPEDPIEPPLTVEIHSAEIDLAEAAPVALALDDEPGPCLVHFALEALDETTLTDAAWATDVAPPARPSLMLSVTSFRREAAVTRTIARFRDFVAGSGLADVLHLTVVDNGRTLDPVSDDSVTVVHNENLGGAGGFARGLLEAQRREADYCLFMDDDAAVHTEAWRRTWTFLAYCRTPRVAIAGAVAHSRRRAILWENGALFHGVCHPQHMGADLRVLDDVAEMEFDSTERQPDNFYGGWWYFAFPVAEVRHLPFPFFVRGDDVSFSLVHDFDIVTLPGVISFQDEDFASKETPLTVYLDLRSHLAHHLSLPGMRIGRAAFARIVLRFYLRALISMHYETLQAVALALGDVRAGPAFFAEGADMADRRADFARLTQDERWRPGAPEPVSARRLSPSSLLARTLMKLTLNGHLLPGFGRFGDRIVLPVSVRGARRLLWGAAEVSYVDEGRFYTVRHSKGRAARLSWRILQDVAGTVLGYEALRKRWHEGYEAQTTQTFWRGKLGLTDQPARSGQIGSA